MGINKCLILSREIRDEYDFLAYYYAIFNMARGQGYFWRWNNGSLEKVEITRVVKYREIFDFLYNYLLEYEETMWHAMNILNDVFGQQTQIEWMNEVCVGRAGKMLTFEWQSVKYTIPLGVTFEAMLDDHLYDPLQAYRKKSRGSLTGVSGLLNDLQRRLSDATIDSSRKEAAFRKLKSLSKECRDLGLVVRDEDDLSIG